MLHAIKQETDDRASADEIAAADTFVALYVNFLRAQADYEQTGDAEAETEKKARRLDETIWESFGRRRLDLTRCVTNFASWTCWTIPIGSMAGTAL